MPTSPKSTSARLTFYKCMEEVLADCRLQHANCKWRAHGSGMLDDGKRAHVWQRCAALKDLPAELPNASGPPHHQQRRIQGRPHHTQRPGLQDALCLQARVTGSCMSGRGTLFGTPLGANCGCFWGTTSLAAQSTWFLFRHAGS